MTISGSMDDKRRKSRSILLTAFVVLVILWIFKLSHPQFSFFPAHGGHELTSTTPEPAENQVKENGASRSGKWKTRPANPQALSTDVFNGTITNKAAVIIETRFRTNIIPLILHFSSVLGYSWPIIIYTAPESLGEFSTSAALAHYVKSKTIQIRTLPQTVFFTNSDSVSKFMTDKWIWEDLAPAEHILTFQSDSMLCSNAARSVDDFFEYDLIGAPIKPEAGKGYNSGLSLRKRSTVLRILEEWDWKETKTDEDRFEDRWYLNKMKMLQERQTVAGISPNDAGIINLPSIEVARTFSVEAIDYPHPLGVRQVHKWEEKQLAPLEEWCPEYKLCREDPTIDPPPKDPPK